MEIKRLLYGKYSDYVISIILGFGLATLFRKVCNERNCLIFKALKINTIENKIYRFDNSCYKVKHKQVPYDKSKKHIPFA